MSYMFYSFSKLHNSDFSNFNTEKVINMAGMFSYCRKIESLDLSTFNIKKVEDMS